MKNSVNDSSSTSSLNVNNILDINFGGILFSHTKELPKIVLGLCIVTILGALLKVKLKDSHFPLPLILFFIGCSFEILSFASYQVKQYAEMLQWMDPAIFINLFTPIIIFSVSFDIDFYMLQKLFWQIIVLTVPGFFLNYALVDWYLFSVNKLLLKGVTRVLFAFIIVCTDPMLTTTAIKNLGLSKGLTHLIKGECIFMAALAENTFKITLHVANNYHKQISTKLGILIVTDILIKFFGSSLFGFIMYKVFLLWLRNIFSDDITEGMLSFSLIYISFYVAEWSGMSGIISLTMLALLLNSTSFKPGAQLFLYKFWKSLKFFAYLMIFTLIGLLIPTHTYLYLSFSDIYYAVHFYFTLIVIRILVFLIMSPILSRLGYGFTWRWAFTIVWSEMRGLLNINMALMFSYSDNTMGTENEKSQVLLHGVLLCLITLVINSITLPRAIIQLGLRDITLTQRKSLYYTVQHFQEIIKASASALKFDRDLANADWNLVDKKIMFTNPYKLKPEEERRNLKCPDCNKEIREATINTEIMELARIRLLSAQIASYERQYIHEILSQGAVKVLVGAAGSFGDKKGEFMSFQTIRAYAEKKKIFNFMRKILLNWVYNTRKEKGVPSKIPILLFCHKIVFNEEFRSSVYLIIILNMAPLLISWIPKLYDIYKKEVRTVNHMFLSFYIIESILKLAAMRKGYFQHNWNLFELMIIIFGVIEEILLSTDAVKNSIYMYQAVVFLKIVNLLRIFRILKLITPLLLQVIDRRMTHQLSFRYAILKGYVQGEADIACIIDKISSSKLVAEELRKRVSMNAERAMKELGYLEYDHPDIAITMKTKEEINSLLGMASEILKNLKSKGIINKAEVAEIHKVTRIIQPVFIRSYINVQWQDKNKNVGDLNFWYWQRIKTELQLDHSDTYYKQHKTCYLQSYFEPYFEYNHNYIFYGNVQDFSSGKENPKDLAEIPVMSEAWTTNNDEEQTEDPQIHLDIENQNKEFMRQSSKYYFGIDQQLLETKEKEKTVYADYLLSGAIIGELNCLTEEPMTFTATCKTVVETYFISKKDIYDIFYNCCPSIEYKMWLKLALAIGAKKVKEILAYEDWTYNLQFQLCNVYVRDVPLGFKVDIYDETVSYVILTYGSVEDCQLQKNYFAPTLIPKTCHQIKGIARITKILVIQTSVDLKKCRSNTVRYVPICEHVRAGSKHKMSFLLDDKYGEDSTSGKTMDAPKNAENFTVSFESLDAF
ncbi:sodium/hydrogen exchanger 10 [Gracilinanus agilis]|uniref:sodium/hydrogen exchanger 10 n=1 Tax=Gracilinanus agilis TaxID=191870 RepID=UPI001CFD4D4C|nr:sodium/hydrogen exchanger 10 [Gracilinanus agilis]